MRGGMEKKKKESSARRDDYSAREGGREGGMRGRWIIHGHRSIDFFFFTSGETKTRASVLNRAEGTVWFSRERGLEFPFLSRNLPNNIRKNKISEIF